MNKFFFFEKKKKKKKKSFSEGTVTTKSQNVVISISKARKSNRDQM